MKKKKLSFTTVKKLVCEAYDFGDPTVDQSEEMREIRNCKNLNELINTLHYCGFNRNTEAYEFLLDCLIKKSTRK